MRRLAPLVALVALAAAPRLARPDGAAPVSLELVDLESAPGVVPEGPLRATLELHPSGAGKGKALREWFPGAQLGQGRVSVILPGRAPEARRRRSPEHRAASFLVDFDGPSFAEIRDELLRRHGAVPTDEDLARFVDAWIVRKSSSRGIDVASTVATRREGDCTEHAVLLAALARLVGRDARVVIGIMLVPVDGALRGFGHAWAEIHDGRGWRTVDATLPRPGVRYLPLASLGDEGPGFLVGAWAVLSPIHVRRVGLAPAPAGARP